MQRFGLSRDLDRERKRDLFRGALGRGRNGGRQLPGLLVFFVGCREPLAVPNLGSFAGLQRQKRGLRINPPNRSPVPVPLDWQWHAELHAHLPERDVGDAVGLGDIPKRVLPYFRVEPLAGVDLVDVWHPVTLPCSAAQMPSRIQWLPTNPSAAFVSMVGSPMRRTASR